MSDTPFSTFNKVHTVAVECHMTTREMTPDQQNAPAGDSYVQLRVENMLEALQHWMTACANHDDAMGTRGQEVLRMAIDTMDELSTANEVEVWAHQVRMQALKVNVDWHPYFDMDANEQLLNALQYTGQTQPKK